MVEVHHGCFVSHLFNFLHLFMIFFLLLSIRVFLTDCVLGALQAQQSNLVQVARSLGRAVPLSPQLIFTPTATVTAVQSESSTQASSQVS